MDRIAVEADRSGSGPWWDARNETLLWVDVAGRLVRRATLDGVELSRIPLDADVTFAIPCGAQLVAGVRSGLALVDETDGYTAPMWSGVPDPVTHRTAGGKTDRRGRLWFGTLGGCGAAPAAGLYSLREDGPVLERDGLAASGGIGWSPDGEVCYHTDPVARVIWAFDYDERRGVLENRRRFASDTPGCVPCGLTVDAEGFVWSVKWGCGRLVRYAPDGRVDRVVELPVRHPTSVGFAGRRLDVLAVTSASLPPHGDLDGNVLLLGAGVTGIAEAPVDPGV